MSDLGNRTVMAANLRRLMESAGKDRNARNSIYSMIDIAKNLYAV